MHKTTFSHEDAMPVRFADRSKDWEKEMILARLALSACLVVGSMASLSAPAAAAGPTGIGGLNANTNIQLASDRRGHGRHYRGGNRGGGHHARGGHNRGGHHARGGNHGRGHHGGGHRNRGNGRGGAFIAGAIVGGLLGWSSGYGYPRAHHQRYQQHHRPYYAPRSNHHRSNNYGGHSRRHYTYSDGGYNNGHNYRRNGGSACHPVSKHGSWHGRPAKVGGTMCYNGHGQGYVVSGSRYLIHYR